MSMFGIPTGVEIGPLCEKAMPPLCDPVLRLKAEAERFDALASAAAIKAVRASLTAGGDAFTPIANDARRTASEHMLRASTYRAAAALIASLTPPPSLN